MKQAVDMSDLRLVCGKLELTGWPYALVGGMAVRLSVDDPAAEDLRPTMDIDTIIEITSRIGLSEDDDDRLRALGFRHDLSEGAPMCRWVLEDVRVDIMPSKSGADRWSADALAHATFVAIGGGLYVPIVTVPYLMAMKIQTFLDRGGGDFMASHDMEDIVALLDGVSDFITRMDGCPREVRSFVAKQFRHFLNQLSFRESLRGHLPPDDASQARYRRLLALIEALVALE